MRNIFRPRRRSRAASIGMALAACTVLGMASAVSGPMKPDVDVLFHEADLDADGAVTRDELAGLDPALATGFDAADDNQDGRLTVAEFAALFS